MPNNLKLYTVLTYILIPIALLFGFLDIIFLLSSLGNPSALLIVFILACFVIYTFTSFKFLKQGIEKEQIQTNKLKDWVKVNAFVSLFLCSLFFINSISLLIMDSNTLIKMIDELLQQQPGMPKEITSAMLIPYFKGLAGLLLVTGIIGIVHIRTTLRLVKQNEHLFE